MRSLLTNPEYDGQADRRPVPNDTNHVAELLPFFVGGTLDRAERSHVLVHLDACSACRETWQAWQSITEATRMLSAGPPISSHLPAAVRAAIEAGGPRRPHVADRTSLRQRADSTLPRAVTPLIGRVRERDEIGALLANSDVRLLTLVGPGGVGKTRLALAAAELASRDFADGVYFVDLASRTDPALVPATIARALGIVPPIDRPVEESLIEHLLMRNLLLVLDNVEYVLGSVRFVPRLLAVCPGIVVLATSREKLWLYGEHVYRVEPLSPPEPDEPANRLPSDLRTLSPREREILCLIASGRGDREIADELGLSVRTVTTIVTRVFQKLSSLYQNRASAAAYAAAHGLCDPSTGSSDGDATPPRPTIPSLSERERQVLCLIADGLTNRGIAERLGVKAITVNVFVTRIFGRLSLDNRAAAAAYSRQHRLCDDQR